MGPTGTADLVDEQKRSLEDGRAIECYEAPGAGDESGMIRRDACWIS